MVAAYTTDSLRVIDADSHLTEPAGLWVDRAPAPLKDRVPRTINDESGRPHWVIDGRDIGPIGHSAIARDGSRIEGETGGRLYERFENVHPAAYDLKARLEWLDEHGIDQQVIFPNIGG